MSWGSLTYRAHWEGCGANATTVWLFGGRSHASIAKQAGYLSLTYGVSRVFSTYSPPSGVKYLITYLVPLLCPCQTGHIFFLFFFFLFIWLHQVLVAACKLSIANSQMWGSSSLNRDLNLCLLPWEWGVWPLDQQGSPCTLSFLERRVHSCLSCYSLYYFSSGTLNTLSKCLKERTEEWRTLRVECGKRACACTRGGTQCILTAAATAATSLHSCPTLCDPINGSPPGSPIPGSLQARTLEGVLQCMKVKNESEVAQSCLTLRDPMDCSPPGSSVHGIFQARVLEWGAIAFSDFDRRAS